MRLAYRLGFIGTVSVIAVAAGCSGSSSRDSLGTTKDAGSDALEFATGEAGPKCAPSPGNFDVPDNNCDDDGDGEVDNPPACDDSLPVDGNAQDFAHAIGLCQKSTGDRWGLVSATFTGSYNTASPANDSQHGILRKFGSVIKPQEGKMLGVLSSGWAREFNGTAGNGSFQQGETMAGEGTVPPGFPKPAKGCEIDNSTNDVITLKLKIKVPNNAKGLAFDFNFYSGEWPQWVCSKFNDGFAAMLTSEAFNGGDTDNISFDSQKNPVSVNNGFFDRCTPGTTTGCAGIPPVTKTSACPGGESELGGTGFFKQGTYCGNKQSTGGGATGWLTSTAPVQAGETVTLEFVIWDTGDARYDSSVLLDNLRWEVGEVQTKTERPK